MAVIDGNTFDSITAHDAAAPIDAHVFCVIVNEQVVLASGGGDVDGVTVYGASKTGRQCSYFTEGGVPVKVGAAGVTADHDVMVEAVTGYAVDATPGSKVVGHSQQTVASGGEARILLQDRPFIGSGAKVGAGAGATGVFQMPLSGAAIHGGVQGIVNPVAATIIITRFVVNVATPAAGACSLDGGTTTVSIATASDNLFDAIDVHTAAGAFGLDSQVGANGKGVQSLAAGKWVTVGETSGDATGLVGTLYIYYTLTA